MHLCYAWCSWVFGLDFIVYYFISSIIIFKVQLYLRMMLFSVWVGRFQLELRTVFVCVFLMLIISYQYTQKFCSLALRSVSFFLFMYIFSFSQHFSFVFSAHSSRLRVAIRYLTRHTRGLVPLSFKYWATCTSLVACMWKHHLVLYIIIFIFECNSRKGYDGYGTLRLA